MSDDVPEQAITDTTAAGEMADRSSSTGRPSQGKGKGRVDGREAKDRSEEETDDDAHRSKRARREYQGDEGSW